MKTKVGMELPPFWMLVESHGSELLRHAQRLVGDGEAEDVLQEALMRALRSYERLDHADHLRAWLFRIATTTAFDHSAKRRGEVVVSEVPERAVTQELPDDGFVSLIERLSPAARAALTLRFVDDLAYEDIAARLDCSPAAARQRVSSGVRELRRRMT